MHPSTSLSFGRVAGRTVFMDLDSDLYFTAAAEEEQELIASAAPAAASPIRASLLEQQAAPAATLRDTLSIFVDLVRLRRALRTERIADLVERFALAPADRHPDCADASLVTLRFAAARKAAPIPRSCLLDSLALIAQLARRSIPSELVFGVKLDPFAAHCWVQSGELLLSDRLEEIERFTPVRLVQCARATR